MTTMADFETKPLVNPTSLIERMELDGDGSSNGDGDGGSSIPQLDDTNALKRKRDEDDMLSAINQEDVLSANINPQLSFYKLKSGICYDVRMRYHCKIVTSSHDYVDPHPEDPRRIYRIYKAIAEAGLIQDPTLQGCDELGPLMEKVPVRECTDEEVLLVHTEKHLEFISSTASMTREELIQETDKGDSIYLSNDSLMAARLSCGGTIEVCKAVVENRIKNGIAVVRPPGHHAEPHAPGGFCLFSNVAVASKVMLKTYPEQVRRILILDWDVHHGNGTQRAFLDDPRVLYISLHRYENGQFYPGGPFGSHSVVGDGPGAGYSVNIAWSSAGMGDGDYLYAFQKCVMPVAYEFDPDLVIISSGFDAAAEDHIGGYFVSPDGYAQMTSMLMQLANGKVAVALEGGYNLNSISISALAVTKTLLGDPPGMVKQRLPSEAAIRDVEAVLRVHSNYWKALRPAYNAIAPKLVEKDCAELANVVRQYQSHRLNTLGLVELPMLKHSTIENQVMATPDIHSAETILFIVHDTPEVWGSTDPVLGSINATKSKLVDPAERFVEFGLGKKFGVIDVCVPPESSSDDLCMYIWDQYAEYFDSNRIVFVGLGKAYQGIVHLAGQQPRAIKSRTKAILSFVGSHPLKPIQPVVDDYTIDWFYKTSVVFLADNHPVYESSNNKKPRKRFGHVLRGDASAESIATNGVYQLVVAHWDDSTEFIEDSLDEADDR